MDLDTQFIPEDGSHYIIHVLDVTVCSWFRNPKYTKCAQLQLVQFIILSPYNIGLMRESLLYL